MTDRPSRQRANDHQLLIALVFIVAILCLGIASCVWMAGVP